MKLLNSNRFWLEGTNNRFLHLATVADGLREYIAFTDKLTEKFYVEQISPGVMGGLAYIEDETIVKEIAAFLLEKNITNVKYGSAEPDKPA